MASAAQSAAHRLNVQQGTRTPRGMAPSVRGARQHRAPDRYGEDPRENRRLG